MYLEAFDQDEVPWGAALRLDRAIETEKNVYIRQLRYCRDQRGTLGVLSGAGQLQVYQTNREYMEPGSVNDIRGSPELLEVKKSYDLEYPYFDQHHKKRFEDRIVGFDWLNLGTSDLPGRVITLRGNGSFEILQMPAPTAGQLSKFIPWKPPHRRRSSKFSRFEISSMLIPLVGDHSLTLMDFKDPSERESNFGPLFASQAKADIPVFGSERFASKSTKVMLDAAVRTSLLSRQNAVINLLNRLEASA